MSDLTEPEIFDQMRQSIRTAVDLCGKLEREPAKGGNYDALRRQFGLIEGCCRQAATWREDARWLRIGVFAARCHETAGSWLRVKSPPRLFRDMARNLRDLLVVADDMKNRATGVSGAILPSERVAPHRDTRPVQVLLPPGFKQGLKSSIILPPGYAR